MKYEFTMFKLESNIMVSGLTPFRFYLLTFGRAPLKPIYTQSEQSDQSEFFKTLSTNNVTTIFYEKSFRKIPVSHTKTLAIILESHEVSLANFVQQVQTSSESSQISNQQSVDSSISKNT